MEARLLPWTTRAVQWHDRAMAIPTVRSWVEILTIVLGISGSFWLLSKALSYVAVGIHGLLDRSLAELFAVLYNLALAVLYSSVLVYAAIRLRGGKNDFLAFEAAGFVVAYLMLKAVYAERSGEISAHALPGYWGGIASYLFFCLRTQYLVNPATPKAYAAALWLTHGVQGLVVTLFGAAAAALQGVRWCARLTKRRFA